MPDGGLYEGELINDRFHGQGQYRYVPWQRPALGASQASVSTGSLAKASYRSVPWPRPAPGAQPSACREDSMCGRRGTTHQLDSVVQHQKVVGG